MIPGAGLHGKVALVTGGSRGIGRAIATSLALHGATVALNSRKQDACAQAAAEISATSEQRVVAFPGNAGKAEDCEIMVQRCIDELGRLDVLINNAAANPQFGPIIDAEDRALDKIWEVNVKGPWRLTSLAVKAWMGENGGSIVNVASIAGIKPEPLTGAYNACKAALINLTKTLARELGPSGIRVNAIAPGLIRTDFSRVLVETDEIRERWIGMSAMRRVGEPDEVAGAATFLASDAASYITGAVLVIDGGTV